MASRDINVNVNVTFLEDGVKIKMIRELTRSDMADKMNGKGSCFLSTFIRNTNDRYSEEKKNIESICLKKELYHIDIDKLSDKKDDDEPICFIISGKYVAQAFIVSKKDKVEFIKIVARAYYLNYEHGEDISIGDLEVRLDDSDFRYSALCADLNSVDSGPHRTFWQAIDSLAKDMPSYHVKMGMLGPCHVEIQLRRIGENEGVGYLISMDEKED